MNLTAALDKATNLLPLTYGEIEEKPVRELKQIAKDLDIPNRSKLTRKAQLLEAIWGELENLRAMLQTEAETKAEAKAAIKQFKRNDSYSIPVTEVASKTYKRLREIVTKSETMTEAKEQINGLVATVARSEMREHESFGTVRTRRSDLKKIMQAMVDDEGRMMRQEMQDGFDYFYSQLLSFQHDDSVTYNKAYKSKVAKSNRSKQEISISGLVAQCQETLNQLEQGKQPHWTKVSIAVALGTGRRMVEVHSLGEFEVIGDYQLHFSGQAKTRGAEDAKDSYDIPTLFPAHQIKLGVDYLDSQDRRLPKDEQLQDRTAVNRTYGMALSRAMQKYKGVNYKGLRAIYAECQWYLFEGKEATEKHIKYSDWLGHIDKEGEQDATFMSYMVYNIQDLDCIDR